MLARVTDQRLLFDGGGDGGGGGGGGGGAGGVVPVGLQPLKSVGFVAIASLLGVMAELSSTRRISPIATVRQRSERGPLGLAKHRP